MSTEFENLVIKNFELIMKKFEESDEFQKFTIEKLNKLDSDVGELKTDVAELKTDVTVLKKDVAELKTDVTVLKKDVAELKTDVTVLKKDVSKLKTDVTILKKEVKNISSDTSMLKNEVFNVVKPTLKSIEQKVDIMTNINTARILDNQAKNHKELMRKIEQYEKENELEHSRLNYEICKLKANA